MAKNPLTNGTKKRIIRELSQILYDHPRYREDSENVQNKFSFEERPQRGIIINNSSGDMIRLSADNYMGRLSSYVTLAFEGNFPGTALEWVRENTDLLASLSKKRNLMPTPPGVYFLEIISVPDEGHKVPGQYIIDPVLTVSNEYLIQFQDNNDRRAQLSHEGIYPNSVRLWLDDRRGLVPGVDFVVDYNTGIVTFLRETVTGGIIYADYRYSMPRQGPFPFQSEEFDSTTLPGAVLAFGERAQKNDRHSIIVSQDRTESAEVFGGKFEVNFDLTIFTRDAEDREKLSDYVIEKVLERQNILGYDGIELLSISPGGEEEEVYVEQIDNYYYESSVSLSVRVDWEYYVPLPIVISRAELGSLKQEQITGQLDGSFVADLLRISNMDQIQGGSVVLGRNFGMERLK